MSTLCAGIRRMLAAAGTAAILVTGVAVVSGVEPAVSGPVTLVAAPSPLTGTSTGPLPSLGVFGKHKHGKGCRGGSITRVVNPAKKCASGAWKGAKGGAEFGGNFGPLPAVAATHLGASGGCWWGIAH